MAQMDQNNHSNVPRSPPQPTGSTTRSELEMSEAIQDCAKQCLSHPDPFACAEAHAIALIADGWTAPDARMVQIGRLRVISRLSGDDSLWPEDE
jgi:hypothetical protein